MSEWLAGLLAAGATVSVAWPWLERVKELQPTGPGTASAPRPQEPRPALRTRLRPPRRPRARLRWS